MEVSPKTLREVEFREKMRGYHPEDVDHFLEQVAAGIEVLQDRLRQAVERAQRAEAAASDSGTTDETLRKTLVLAQRTADMAVQEARDQASRILASAEAQAQSILADAEDRGRRTLEDTIAECRAELSRLETTRSQAQQDVESLQRWLDEHKAHLQESLSDAMAAVDRAGILWPAPSTRPLDGVSAGISPRLTAAVPPPPEPVAAPVPPPEPPLAADNLAWSAADDIKLDVRDSSSLQQAPPSARREAERVIDDPDQQALDDFFEDNEDFDDDRRFGGRLRRRR